MEVPVSAADFAKSLPRILVYEGGKSNNPKDPGGRTNRGITQTTYTSFLREYGRPNKDVYNIADDEVQTIYKDRYWDVCDCDDLPIGLDFVVFDASVNSGPGHSVIWLQQSLGDVYRGAIDGVMGAKTIQAVEDHGDIDGLIADFCSHRLATLEHLTTWKDFGAGWHARIANGQKTALAWADGSAAPHPVDVTDKGGHQKAPVAGNIKPLPVSQIATHVTTAASASGVVATQAVQQITPMADTFTWIKYVLGGLTCFSVAAGILVKVASSVKDQAEKGAATATVDVEADIPLTHVSVNDNAPPPVNLIASPTPPAKAA